MLKHILHYACNRDCSYCITKNVKTPPVKNLMAVEDKYREMYEQGHKAIMLTGGEPLLYKHFEAIKEIAARVFDAVYLTTQYVPKVMAKGFDTERHLEAITFSIHDKDEEIPTPQHGHTVYASILDLNFAPYMVAELAEKGYSGLTLNEEQFGGKPRFSEFFYADIELLCKELGLSFRVNRLGHCMDETIILPDLRVITDFREFM